jgi:hypothetical protein
MLAKMQYFQVLIPGVVHSAIQQFARLTKQRVSDSSYSCFALALPLNCNIITNAIMKKTFKAKL